MPDSPLSLGTYHFPAIKQSRKGLYFERRKIDIGQISAEENDEEQFSV